MLINMPKIHIHFPSPIRCTLVYLDSISFLYSTSLIVEKGVNNFHEKISVDKERAERSGLEQQLREKVREAREIASRHDAQVDDLSRKYLFFESYFFLTITPKYQYTFIHLSIIICIF